MCVLFNAVQDTSFRQEIEQFPELGLLILDAMQEAEIDNTCDRTKRRRRTTDSTGENGSALVPRQVCDCEFVRMYVRICECELMSVFVFTCTCLSGCLYIHVCACI